MPGRTMADAAARGVMATLLDRTGDALAAIAAAGLTPHQAEVIIFVSKQASDISSSRTSISASLFRTMCGSDRRANTSHSTRTSPNASRCGGLLPSGVSPGGRSRGGRWTGRVPSQYIESTSAVFTFAAVFSLIAASNADAACAVLATADGKLQDRGIGGSKFYTKGTV